MIDFAKICTRNLNWRSLDRYLCTEICSPLPWSVSKINGKEFRTTKTVCKGVQRILVKVKFNTDLIIRILHDDTLSNDFIYANWYQFYSSNRLTWLERTNSKLELRRSTIKTRSHTRYNTNAIFNYVLDDWLRSLNKTGAFRIAQFRRQLVYHPVCRKNSSSTDRSRLS